MIVVTVEVRSARGKRHNQVVGCMVLGNLETSSDGKRANYSVRVLRRSVAAYFAERLNPFDRETLDKLDGATVRRGVVEGFPRESYSVWRLVLRALRAAFHEER